MQRFKPIEPLPEDCCGQGCIPCVNDIYEEELKLWEAENSQVTLQNSHANQASADGNSLNVLSRDAYAQFILSDIIQDTNDTFIYRFALPFPDALLLNEKTDIGKHLILRLSNQTGGELESGGSITRQYTIITSPRTKGYFDIMIKLYKNGQASQIIRKWKVADCAEFRGPFGEFSKKFMNLGHDRKIQLEKYSNIVMISAGTGIAPMIQVIKYILEDEESETRLHLLYSCRNTSGILLKKEIKLFADFWNFKVTYFLTREENEEASVNSKISCHYAKTFYQRITKGTISKYLDTTLIRLEQSNSLFLVCGTKSFEVEMLENCKNIGVSTKDTFKF